MLSASTAPSSAAQPRGLAKLFGRKPKHGASTNKTTAVAASMVQKPTGFQPLTTSQEEKSIVGCAVSLINSKQLLIDPVRFSTELSKKLGLVLKFDRQLPSTSIEEAVLSAERVALGLFVNRVRDSNNWNESTVVSVRKMVQKVDSALIHGPQSIALDPGVDGALSRLKPVGYTQCKQVYTELMASLVQNVMLCLAQTSKPM